MKKQVNIHLKSPDTHTWMDPGKEGAVFMQPLSCASHFPTHGLHCRTQKWGLFLGHLKLGPIPTFGEDKECLAGPFQTLNHRGERGIPLHQS